ncbi:unnamed protein product [Linum trigynum]|uniref:Uncharacterized protein n=1 Tax=Linum trigynum TaxID=586398 RepID=A0AAV2GEN8_9ROSI
MSSPSSSCAGNYRPNKAMILIVMVAVSLVMSLRTQSASAQVTGWLCNLDHFGYDDQRILCVYRLIDNMVGDRRPVNKGAWYKNEDYVDGSIIYGYRRRMRARRAASVMPRMSSRTYIAIAGLEVRHGEMAVF